VHASLVRTPNTNTLSGLESNENAIRVISSGSVDDVGGVVQGGDE
jgi:hypothetical protein